MLDDSSLRPAFFGRSMKRRWRLISAMCVIGLVAAGAYIGISSAKYSSTSIVFLQPLEGNPYSPLTPASRSEQLAAFTTEAGLVGSDAVVKLATQIVEAGGSPLEPSRVSTEVPSNSQVLHITYTEAVPAVAQTGAQALAEAYLQYREDRAAAVAVAQKQSMDEELASVSALLDTASAALDAARAEGAVGAEAAQGENADVLDLQRQVVQYADRLAEIQLMQTAASAAPIIAGDIITDATLPTEHDGVGPVLIGAGLFLGIAALGVLFALLREHADTRIHDSEGISASGIAPVFGQVPVWDRLQHGESARESYRRLYNALHLTDAAPGMLLLAGVSSDTPTWSVSAGIAEAIEEAGVPAILVLATEEAGPFADVSSPGLTDLLDGRYSPALASELLIQVTDNIAVLGLGTRSARLPALVQNRSLGAVLGELARSSRPVIVAGPAIASATTAVLLHHAQQVLVVVAEGNSTAAEVGAAAELLDQEGMRSGGAVLLQRPPKWPAPPTTYPAPFSTSLFRPAAQEPSAQRNKQPELDLQPRAIP